ncbi:MAG: glycosyltransferase [Candidatus Saccharibacteria bacterium]
MQKVTLPQEKAISAYKDLVSKDILEELHQLSSRLKGKKVVEINATSFGGGVAELLRSQVPLMRELGIDVDWYVLPPDDRFFTTTKQLHNCLQGICPLHPEIDLDYYQAYSDGIAKHLPEADIYILHDPQTLGLAKHLKAKHVVWRCHIDLSDADTATHDWLKQHYQHITKAIFSLEAYVHGLDRAKTAIVHPAIDPFNKKNRLLTQEECRVIIARQAIDQNRPYILQVSRFDKFKDPLGVLHIFAELKKRVPDLQCVLMGNYATDDPEGIEYYKVVHTLAKKVDPYNAHIIVQADDLTINAFQRQAVVVIQNSTKEGFGLTVTEALWKKKIVFSRPVGGIALQIINNKTGYYLTDNTNTSAHKIAEVLSDDSANQKHITQTAHQLVRKRFITPIMVRDYLRVYSTE